MMMINDKQKMKSRNEWSKGEQMLKIMALIALCSVSFLACKPKVQERVGKLKIVCTTGMLEDAVRNIAGEAVEVEALMGPGVDPHLYKASQGDLQKLTGADVIVYNGLHLEGKMAEVFHNMSEIKPVIAGADGIAKDKIKKMEGTVDTYDPHVWFDVMLWSDVVKYLSVELSKLDTANAATYQANADRYLKQLDTLNQKVKEQVLTIPETQRVLITAHDAFGYYGKAYQIEVKGLQGISTMSEFGLKDVSDLVNFIKDRKIKAVFVETSVSDKALKAVVEGCKERGHEVLIGGSLYSDAMGAKGTFAGTYIGMVSTNTETIVNSLK